MKNIFSNGWNDHFTLNINYCHRVTADDGKMGEQHIRDFQDNEKSIPTILGMKIK